MEQKIFQHLNPVLREKANFLIFANVPPPAENPDGIYKEQLWCRQISKFEFEICCIPFFAYNLALGDEVETNSDYIITRLVKYSGHYTFRVWFNQMTTKENRDKVLDEIDELQCLIEFYSANLLGVDADTEMKAQSLANALAKFEGEKILYYETGKQ